MNKKSILFKSFVMCIMMYPIIGFSQQHPNIYINQFEINAVKSKIGSEPWRSAYSKIISNANSALNKSLQSVTYQGSKSNDYYTQGAYDWSNNMPSPCGRTICDGRLNPKADRADYGAAINFSHAVANLGLGYAFTGDARYANKAIQLINNWCVKSSTRMIPRYNNRQQSFIELSITIPGAFYGADLIYNYPGWNASDKAAFLSWANSFTSDATTWSRSNNFENWRLVVLSTGGALLNNQSLLNTAFSKWKALIPNQINANGSLEEEITRTTSLSYSTYALNAMTQTAEVARHRGVDLYNYKSNGRGLELAFDFHAPYMLNPSSWPYQQIHSYSGDNAAIMELAYLYKQKSAYINVINKWKRPMNEDRIMTVTTLTHAYGAYRWTAGGNPPPAGGRDAFSQIEAESLNGQHGLNVYPDIFGYFDTGDWAKYSQTNFGSGAHSVNLRLAVPYDYAGKTIELRIDSPTGTLIGSHTVQGTGGWSTYQTQNASVNVSGIHDLYIVGNGGQGIANLDWLRFQR